MVTKYVKLTDDLKDKYLNMQGYAFIPEKGPDFPDLWKGPDIGEKKGLISKDELLSVGRLLKTKLSLRNELHPVGGIADIVTMPENRGKGYFKKFFYEIFNDLTNQGIYLSLLWPSSYQIYKKLGYQIASKRMIYSLDLKDFLVDTQNDGDLIPVNANNEKTVLPEVYNQVYTNFNLALIRDNNWWDAFVTKQSKVSSGKKAYIYAVKFDKYEGYIIFTFKNNADSKIEIVVRELLYTTNRAYKRLLNFIAGHNLQADMVTFEGSIDEYFPDNFIHPEAISCKQTLGPAIRIIDTYTALEKLSYDEKIDDSIILEVCDHFYPKNTGTFQLTIKNGQAVIQKTNDIPDVSVDIGTLSQMYIGYIDPISLYNENRLTINNDKLSLLSKMFPKYPIYPTEYF
ncbi:GNAT family N-acetyltransferase [Natranaerobius trueperi]|nr:GNAT family N-acetyltransferase [Natranaerobius trueperi]